jgi:hypothetical protein
LLIGESEIQDEAIELDIRGNAEIKYDSCVLGEVENLWVPLSRPTKMVAWKEEM